MHNYILMLRGYVCMYTDPTRAFYVSQIQRFRKRGSQVSLLFLLIVGLNLVTDLELEPVLEADTAFAAFLHFHYVFLDVFE